MTAEAATDGSGERTRDLPTVPDTALRSALEFAVGLAAEGQKLRPALLYPAALKPYLRSGRLDAAALRSVRRALVADDAFRDRIASVDLTELVDDIGQVWLRRPDGWQDELPRLLAVARQQAAEASAEAALRKSEKRREAAEHAAARAQAELIGQRDAIGREVTRRGMAEDRARIAEAKLAGLQDELTGVRREVAKADAAAAAAAARAERAEVAVAEITRRLAEVERIRDELIAQRHVVTAVAEAPAGETVAAEWSVSELATAKASVALRQAAVATRDLAAALEAAGTALVGRTTAPPDSASAAGCGTASSATDAHRPSHGLDTMPGIKPIRTRPHRRQPIPIPGGLYGDSVAAAEHLFRVAGVRVIVDGYNVAKLAWPNLDLAAQRECCIELVEDVVRRLGTDIKIVFDGAEVVGASAPRRRLIPVQFSPPGVSADDVIRRDVSALPSRTPAIVVTNDRAIIADVRASGVNVVTTESLIALAGRGRGLGR